MKYILFITMDLAVYPFLLLIYIVKFSTHPKSGMVDILTFYY